MNRAAAFILVALAVLSVGNAVANERSAADIVRIRSATRAHGPLPPPARVESKTTPRDLLAALRATVAQQSRPGKSEPDVDAWRHAVERMLEQEGLKLTFLSGEARDVEVGGARGSSLEVHYKSVSGGLLSFQRLEGGTEEAARTVLDVQFEPVEMDEFFVRRAKEPGERAVVTNMVSYPQETVRWQVGRVVVELMTAYKAEAVRIDAAALKAGLYAAKLEAAAPDKGMGKGKGKAPDKDHEESVAKAKAYDIPALKANVAGLKFYEGRHEGDPPLDQRVGRERFATESTRAIWWELALAFRPPGHRKDFRIDARWLRQDGSVLAEQTLEAWMESDWISSRHTKGYGQAFPATWDRGTYRVELSVAGRIVASGSFEVTSPARVRNLQLQHNQTDPQGQVGVLITFQLETWGRLQQPTSVIAYVQYPNGTSLKDFDGHYADGRGLVASQLSVVPNYESAIWKKAQIFFPYAQMHMEKGKHDLVVQLVVYDPKTGTTFTRSNRAPMTVTWN